MSSGILWSTKQNISSWCIWRKEGVRQEFLQYVWKFSGSPRFDYLYANKDVELGPSNDILKDSGVTVMRNWLDISEDQLLSFYDSCEQMLHTSCPALRIAYSWGIFQIQIWNRWRAVFSKLVWYGRSTCCAPTEEKKVKLKYGINYCRFQLLLRGISVSLRPKLKVCKPHRQVLLQGKLALELTDENVSGNREARQF